MEEMEELLQVGQVEEEVELEEHHQRQVALVH